MTAILYPVAETAEAALHAPLGYAAREREAQMLAAASVGFVSEAVGPAFATREAAMEAYGGQDRTAERLDGLRKARLDEAHGLRLVPVTDKARAGLPTMGPPLEPTYSGGRRWPKPAGEAAVLWRLSISFWRIGVTSAEGASAKKTREAGPAQDVSEGVSPILTARARQPLRALKPQQPLDIGLFEIRPPEAPDTLIPDE